MKGPKMKMQDKATSVTRYHKRNRTYNILLIDYGIRSTFQRSNSTVKSDMLFSKQFFFIHLISSQTIKTVHAFQVPPPTGKVSAVIRIDFSTDIKKPFSTALDLGKNSDIDKIFQEAKAEDEEWYNSFVRDVLGEDTEILMTSKDVSFKQSDDPSSKKKSSESDYRKWKIGEPENPAKKEISTQKLMSEDHDKDANFRERTNEYVVESSRKNKNDDLIVQFIDMNGDKRRIPFSILEGLGYTLSDVTILQAEVLELILEDDIPLPEKGLPNGWIISDFENKEVTILKRRHNQDTRLETERQSSRKRNRRKESLVDRDRSRSRPISRRNETSGSIWMDIPSFKNFLRREAEFRLSILGPDWEDWVRGESEWRLDLYKKWLNLLKDGYGDDIMNDLYPNSERAISKQKRTKPSVAGRRERPRSTSPRDVTRRGAEVERQNPVSKSVLGDRSDRYQPKRATSDRSRRPSDVDLRESNFKGIEDYVVGMIQDLNIDKSNDLDLSPSESYESYDSKLDNDEYRDDSRFMRQPKKTYNPTDTDMRRELDKTRTKDKYRRRDTRREL